MKLLNYPKKIAWWHGTDALKLVMYPPGPFRWHVRIFLHRIFWRLAWRFFDVHYVNHAGLIKALEAAGISPDRIRIKPVPHSTKKYKKADHDRFTVLFYMPANGSPKQYAEWIYGREVLNFLESKTGIHLIVADGSLDMSDVYPKVDAYIKVNRTIYNGLNRIGKECKANDIPVMMLKMYGRTIPEYIREVDSWINTKRDIWLTKKRSAKS